MTVAVAAGTRVEFCLVGSNSPGSSTRGTSSGPVTAAEKWVQAVATRFVGAG